MMKHLVTTQINKPLTVLVSDSQQVKYVCWGLPPERGVNDILIAGERARLLYQALSGHAWGEHPATATPDKALKARWKISQMENTALLRLVLLNFGHRYEPWLGVTRLVDGKIVANSEAVSYPLESIQSMKALMTMALAS